jgi:hypothetical protein
VEFAIVAPLFFFIFFSVINGGLLLFSRNAIQHAADVGAAEIAAEGDVSTATAPSTLTVDQVAIAAMDQAGLNHALLTTVTKITVWKEDQSSSSGSTILTLDATGCGGSPCENTYNSTGQLQGTEYWPDNDRSVNQANRIDGIGGNPDFAQLQVTYTFTFIGTFAPITLTSTVVFRLEPQSL